MELKVSKIEQGTVIDHIRAGRASKVLEILNLEQNVDNTIITASNVNSDKHGKKDIVKIEDKTVDTDKLDKIAIISPQATVNIIDNYEVVKKQKVQVPEQIRGLLDCPNPNCITNSDKEKVSSWLKTCSRDPIKMECHYCERVFRPENNL